jgi:hypothetical protein
MDARERAASGKAVRSRVRRSSDASWAPPGDRVAIAVYLGAGDVFDIAIAEFSAAGL